MVEPVLSPVAYPDPTRLPKASELFPLPKASELFPAQEDQAYRGFDPQLTPLDGPTFDKMFSEGRPGHILNLFFQGAVHGWGTKPLAAELDQPTIDPNTGGPGKSTAQWLRENGLWSDFEKGQSNVIRTFNESLMRSTAIGLDLLFRRAPSVVIGGVANVVPGVGALAEAFPAGHMAGFPTLAPRGPSMLHLEEAAKLGLLEEKTPVNVAREALAPDQTGITVRFPNVEEVPERAAEEPPGPPDVHTIARQIAPEVFDKYDPLVQQKQELTDLLDELRRERDIPAQARIDELLSKVNGIEDRLTRRQSLRLGLARKELEELQSVDSPTMAAVRRNIQELDYQMRDLAPEVYRANREAEAQLPREPVVEAAPPVEAPTPTAEVIPFPEPTEAAPPREIATLAQRGPTIARDVEQQLRAAGRPIDEASFYGALTQAYYETRAARFEGALGTARQLYAAEGPQIIRDISTTLKPGQYSPIRNTITLFRRANASTFLHEAAHNWTFQLARDSEHPRAPADLIADWQTLRDWAGFKEGVPVEATSNRAAHEKIARGFERYLMEGYAPTTRLAGVFKKLKQWLTDIYQTVERLRAPIDDEIRGVYDRLLSKPIDRAVIAEERAGEATLADDHEFVAREATPDVAEVMADRLRTERDRMAEVIQEALDAAKKEIFGGRRIAARGPTRTRVPERSEPTGESIAAGEGVAAPDEAVGEGRNPPSGKSETPADVADGFEPVDLPLVDKAGNIRLENLDVPEDVKSALREVAAENAGFIEARRDVLSDAEVKRLSEALLLDPTFIDRRKIGEAFSAEQITAAIKLLEDAGTAYRDASAKAVSGDVNGMVEYATARERLTMIQGQFSGIAAESGRALRAFRNINKLEYDELNALFQSTLGVDIPELRREAAAALILRTTPEINRFVRKIHEPTWRDKAIEAWSAGLVSGFLTQLVNVTGNALAVVNSIVEPAAASLGGNVPKTVALDNARAIYGGALKGTVAAWEVLKNEELLNEANRPIQLRHSRSIGGTSGQAIRVSFRVLGAMDTLFKGIAIEQKSRELARLQATAEGLEGEALRKRIQFLTDNPPDSWTEALKAYADYQTYTTPLGPKGRALQQMVGDNLVGGFLFPFVRTPINLAKYELERTPLGFASKQVRANLRSADPYVRDMQIARLAIGTTVLTAVTALAFAGDDTSEAWLTGGGPFNGAEFNTWKQKGWQPYSVRIGSSYYSYRNVLPGGAAASVVADLVQAVRLGHKVPEDKIDRVYAGLVANLAKDAANILPLRSLTGLVAASVDPDRYGPQYAQQTAGSLIPALSAQTAQLIDPVVRDSRGIIANEMSRVPFVSRLLPEAVNMWGQPILRSEQGRLHHDPIEDEIVRLGMGIAQPQRKIDEVQLTPEQYHDYRALSGSLARQMLEAMMGGSGWGSVPDGKKRDLISSRVEAARKMARGAIKAQSYGTDNDIITKAHEKFLEKLR